MTGQCFPDSGPLYTQGSPSSCARGLPVLSCDTGCNYRRAQRTKMSTITPISGASFLFPPIPLLILGAEKDMVTTFTVQHHNMTHFLIQGLCRGGPSAPLVPLLSPLGMEVVKICTFLPSLRNTILIQMLDFFQGQLAHSTNNY